MKLIRTGSRTTCLSMSLISILLAPQVQALEIGLGSPDYQGDSINVPIHLSHDGDLIGAQFDLIYDPATISPGTPEAIGLSSSGHLLRSNIVREGVQRLLIVPPLSNAPMATEITITLPIDPVSETGSSQLLIENFTLSGSGGDITPDLIRHGLVELKDQIPPELTLPADLLVEANAVLSSVEIGTATAIDNRDGPVPVTHNAPAGFPIGDTHVLWSAEDSSGNVAEGTQLVTVQDTTAPELTAPAAITKEATGPETPIEPGSAVATDIFPLTVTNDLVPSGYSVGEHVILWTALDANGNSSSVTQAVTITDTTPPTLTIPADILAEANAVLSTVEIGTASAVDLVDGVVAVSNNAPAVYPLGATQVLWSSSDSRGNASQATQTITVQDTTPPELTAPADIKVTATSSQTQIDIGNAVATDIFPVEVSHDAPTSFTVGTTVITWTAVDANGNQTTASQSVTARYHSSGILAPLNKGKPMKAGRTLPVKVQLTYADGSQVLDATPTAELIDSNGNVVANEGLRLSDDQYIANLRTKGLSAGTYTLKLELHDGSEAAVQEVTLK